MVVGGHAVPHAIGRIDGYLHGQRPEHETDLFHGEPARDHHHLGRGRKEGVPRCTLVALVVLRLLPPQARRPCGARSSSAAAGEQRRIECRIDIHRTRIGLVCHANGLESNDVRANRVACELRGGACGRKRSLEHQAQARHACLQSSAAPVELAEHVSQRQQRAVQEGAPRGSPHVRTRELKLMLTKRHEALHMQTHGIGDARASIIADHSWSGHHRRRMHSHVPAEHRDVLVREQRAQQGARIALPHARGHEQRARPSKKRGHPSRRIKTGQRARQPLQRSGRALAQPVPAVNHS